MNKNDHNSRISHDIDMKLAPVAKLDKRNTSTSKNFDDEGMSANCDQVMTDLQSSDSHQQNSRALRVLPYKVLNFKHNSNAF